ncbi:hypothetical protein FBQ97_18200 [Acidobacteria bacterium ACD]|nr:hypothetical protein [Acidobacteria bacterium ACD]
MGDFYSRMEEDPVDALRAAGWVDVLGTASPNDRSYVYGGQSDRVDHAFANPAMAAYVTGATVWHVNADESRRMDYNLEYRPAVDAYDAPARTVPPTTTRCSSASRARCPSS